MGINYFSCSIARNKKNWNLYNKIGKEGKFALVIGHQLK